MISSSTLISPSTSKVIASSTVWTVISSLTGSTAEVELRLSLDKPWLPLLLLDKPWLPLFYRLMEPYCL